MNYDTHNKERKYLQKQIYKPQKLIGHKAYKINKNTKFKN